jgi:hypothetical protein
MSGYRTAACGGKADIRVLPTRVAYASALAVVLTELLPVWWTAS